MAKGARDRKSIIWAYDELQNIFNVKLRTPEELFGPISLKALEQDQFTRVVTGKLPEAQFAFVDEVFKANSAILNSLLTLLNAPFDWASLGLTRAPASLELDTRRAGRAGL